MLIQLLTDRVKSLLQSIKQPRTYGSELEAYIVTNNPKDSGDIDRLTREFNNRMNSSRSFPC